MKVQYGSCPRCNGRKTITITIVKTVTYIDRFLFFFRKNTTFPNTYCLEAIITCPDCNGEGMIAVNDLLELEQHIANEPRAS